MKRRDILKGLAVAPIVGLANHESCKGEGVKPGESYFECCESINVGHRIVGVTQFRGKLIVACADGRVFDITERNLI